MCIVSQDTLDKLNETVKQFTAEGRMFTGYDVTVETREREDMNLRHRDVRGDIHTLPALQDEFDFGDYDRHQLSVSGGGWAWVYHHKSDDPNQYIPRDSSQSTTATVATTPSTDDHVRQDSGGIMNDGKYGTDVRNRLMVEKKFMEQANMSPGQQCYVHHDVPNSSLILKSSQDQSRTFLGSYQVERNGDLRIGAKSLRELSKNASKFQVKNENGEVVIETA